MSKILQVRASFNHSMVIYNRPLCKITTLLIADIDSSAEELEEVEETDNEEEEEDEEEAIEISDDEEREENNADNVEVAVGNWVAAAIKHTRGRGVTIFYGQVTEVSIEQHEITVNFLKMNKYKMLFWPQPADIGIVDVSHITKISEPVPVSQSTSRTGGLQISDVDIQRAIRILVV